MSTYALRRGVEVKPLPDGKRNIDAGDVITFVHPVLISAEFNGERTAINVQVLLNVKTTKSGKNHS